MWKWFKRLVSGRPHLYIGGEVQPYMKRWYLIPRNKFMNLYLHKFYRDDDDRALHDHPWWFASIMLRGGYVEHQENKTTKRGIGSIAFRKATTKHRVTLNGGSAMTLVLTGRKKREWGFWCPKGFVVWHDFVKTDDEGQIGKGCE